MAHCTFEILFDGEALRPEKDIEIIPPIFSGMRVWVTSPGKPSRPGILLMKDEEKTRKANRRGR